MIGNFIFSHWVIIICFNYSYATSFLYSPFSQFIIFSIKHSNSLAKYIQLTIKVFAQFSAILFFFIYRNCPILNRFLYKINLIYLLKLNQIATGFLYTPIQTIDLMGPCASKNNHQPNLHKIKIDKSKSGITFGLASMKGWRKFMEDTHISIINYNDNPELSLFAVFDGHGGSQVAIFVKQQFPKQLKKNPHFLYGNYPQALRETFILMDQMLCSQQGIRRLQEIIEDECNNNNARNLFGNSKAGCTALVCLVTPCMIFVANAGDSRGIAFANDECIQINTEHKPTLQEESKRIIQAGGQIIYDRVMGDINISRCIGDFAYKQNPNISRDKQMIICDPEIIEIERQKCQYFLIASDGVWESKDNLTMHNWLADKPRNMKISQKLCLLFDEQVSRTQATEYGKDNMTAILVQFH